MALKKITDADLEGKGIRGQPDVPGLTAEEMQRAVEQIVREVVIPILNGNVDEINANYATRSDLDNIVINAGAVTSVFGRRGEVKPQKGDYTADMVGAAAAKHAASHAKDGSDPIDLNAAGIASAEHSHGNISHDGKVGAINGKILMTGIGGSVIAADKSETGLVAKPSLVATSGAVSITVEDNREYEYTGVTSLTMVGANVECFGTVVFADGTPTIDVSGFESSAGDDVTSAAAGETWEFSCYKNRILWKNWGGLNGA